MQDCMHLVLDPSAMPHDLVAPRHQPALALGGGVGRPNLRQIPSRVQVGERAGINLIGLYVSAPRFILISRLRERLNDESCFSVSTKPATAARRLVSVAEV